MPASPLRTQLPWLRAAVLLAILGRVTAQINRKESILTPDQVTQRRFSFLLKATRLCSDFEDCLVGICAKHDRLKLATFFSKVSIVSQARFNLPIGCIFLWNTFILSEHKSNRISENENHNLSVSFFI